MKKETTNQSHTNALPENNDGLKTPIREPKTAKKVGRPQKTTNDLPPDWKEVILEMSSQGMSAVEIRAKLCTTGTPGQPDWKFNHDLWDALKARDAEFSATLLKGSALCQAWWEEQGRKIGHLMHNKAEVFETGLWYANMKNRFGWRDRTEVEHDLTDEAYQKLRAASVDELQKEIDMLMPNRVAKLLKP